MSPMLWLERWLDPDARFSYSHPYRWRTMVRGNLPYPLLWLSPKGRDCESAGGWHHWYNRDGASSGCYHCQLVKPGQLWRVWSEELSE